MALDKRRFLSMPEIFKSSITTQEARWPLDVAFVTMAVVVFCKESFLRFAILAWIRASRARAFARFLLPFFLEETSFDARLSCFKQVLNAFGLGVVVPSEQVASALITT